GKSARARRGHRGRDRRHRARRRPGLGRRHGARHARVRDARERDEPPPDRLQLATDLHRPRPARRGPDLSRETLMTRLITIALLAALGLPDLAGCARKDGPEVAFLLSTLQEERYQKDVKYFEARAQELGMRVVTLAA